MLLTGATGFVGRNLLPSLEQSFRVLCATRDVSRARRADPGRDWVHFDIGKPETFEPAMRGCHSLVYLVHSMGDGAGYEEREANAARELRRVAAETEVKRIVYLGGPAPRGPVSPHLRSRLETGRLLREGRVPVVELRASMIIGHGSASWQMVEDLASRLPAMVLPRWLSNSSSPVGIDDVVVAVTTALDDAVPRGWYDVPGADYVTHRELLMSVCAALGKRPKVVGVPIVTPSLSSYWIALVTRTDLHLARELVQGLQSDLLPSGRSIWELCADHEPVTLSTAIERALAAERSLARARKPLKV